MKNITIDKSKKPRCLFISPEVEGLFSNSDALSMGLTIFKNGGSSGGGEAKPFVELTPELIEILRSIEWV